MDCFERAAMEKMKGVESEGSGPKMLIIKLKMPSKSEGESEGGYEEEDTGDMPSGPQGYGPKAKMLFDAVNEVVGMKHDWTPEIEKKLVEKLGMLSSED
jgi:hypothetical protein